MILYKSFFWIAIVALPSRHVSFDLFWVASASRHIWYVFWLVAKTISSSGTFFAHAFIQIIAYLDLTDFTTAEFDVVATFQTDNPYSNNQNEALDITCNNTFNVAFLFEQFNTQARTDFVSVRDIVNNTLVMRKSTIDINDIFEC